MEENKISVVINSSIKKVFEIVINPKNTPLWIDEIVKEETNEFPVKIGTKYKNLNKNGDWSEYEVIQFVQNKIFELKSKNSSYHVTYTFELISDNQTKLTYFEWVDNGELNKPFPPEILEKLKKVIEEANLPVLALLRLKYKYYLPFILIIAVILVTSLYYATYYPHSTSLPCNSIPECIVSYGTAIFNGYTETMSGLIGIGGNVYENVSFTILILLALPTVAIVTKKEAYLKPILISIVFSQFIFLLIYPKFIEPLLTTTPNFGGGLSLFGTFSLIVISIMILVSLFKKCLRLNLVQSKLEFFNFIMLPLIQFGLISFIYLTLGNLLSLSIEGTALNYQIILAFFMILFMSLIIFMFYRNNKNKFSQGNLDPKSTFGFLILYMAACGIAFAILFSTYLLPPFLFYPGLALKAILNPHNFGWPIFVAVTWVLWTKKLFGFK